MAEPTTSGQRQPTGWRCLVSGCRIEGVWQPVFPGEEYLPPSDPRSHYFREHYVETEKAYQQKLAEQQQRRREHYRLTGEFLPPEL